jgi:superfamily I DNA and/or RNA helicase
MIHIVSWLTKGGIRLANLSELELQNLRHLIGGHETCAMKLDTYAQQCQDPQIKQMLQSHANAARQSKQQLMSFLG